MARTAKGIFLDRDLNDFIQSNTMSKEEFERRQAELAAEDEAAAKKERPSEQETKQ